MLPLAIAGMASQMGNQIHSQMMDYANFGMQWLNREDQLRMQRKSWLREDSAVQRRALDLKAAGLSPVLAAGGAAETSGPIRTEAPQMGKTDNEIAQYALQAMQMDDSFKSTAKQRELVQAQIEKQQLEKKALQMDVSFAERNDMPFTIPQPLKTILATKEALEKQAKIAAEILRKKQEEDSRKARQAFEERENKKRTEAAQKAVRDAANKRVEAERRRAKTAALRYQPRR